MAISPFTCFEQLTTDGLAALNAGSVTVYLAGTTNLVSLFANDDLTGAVANPITLDGAGRHAMKYMAAAKYKILTKDSLGNTIKTYDNIDPAVPLGTGVLAIANGGTGASTAPAAITALGGATAAEVAAIAADVAALTGTLGAVDKTHIATGTTGQRPLVPVVGDIRHNTTTSRYEGYTGAAWAKFYEATHIAADLLADLPASDTVSGVIELAVQSEMEAGTDVLRAVVPGRQQFHPSAAKMWGYVTVSGGTPTLQSPSYNITSITDTAAGRLTVTIGTDFSSAVWSPCVGTGLTGESVGVTTMWETSSFAAGSFEIKGRRSSDGALTDPAAWSFAGFGDR